MGVKLVLEHFDNKSDLIIEKTRIINNLDDNLAEHVYKLTKKSNTISFADYKWGDEQFEVGRFPFILKNGVYEWHVPLSEVSVLDYISTFDINENDGVIYACDEGIGGSDLDLYINDIVEWISFIWQCFAFGFTTNQIIKVVMPIYYKLIGKDKRVASPDEFAGMLQSKDEWTIDEIKQKIAFEDKNAIEAALNQSGFKKKGEMFFKHMRIDSDGEEYNSQYKDYSEDIWGKTTYRNQVDDLREAVANLNKCITSVLLQSEIAQSDSFAVILNIVDCFVDQWETKLKRGKRFRFIEVKRGITDADEEYKDILERTEDLCLYVSAVCEYLDKVIQQDTIGVRLNRFGRKQ